MGGDRTTHVCCAPPPRPRTLREPSPSRDRPVRARQPRILGLFFFSRGSGAPRTADGGAGITSHLRPFLRFTQVVNNGFDALWESRNKGKLYKDIVGNFPPTEEE